MNMHLISTRQFTSNSIFKASLRAITLSASLSLSLFTQAAIVTYTFSGTVDTIDEKKLDDAASFGFDVGNIFYGSFSLDNTIPPSGSTSNKSEYTNGINFSFTVATSTGTEIYSSIDTASDANESNDIKLTVEDNKDKFKIEDKDDSFRSGVTGSQGNNNAFALDFDKFKIEIQDSSKSVFSNSALPISLDLNDFDSDHLKMELKFTASGGKELKVKGVLDSLSASIQTPSGTGAVVPIPAAAWLFFSAIGGLGLLKQRRQR